MTKWTKALFVLSFALLVLSYPACHLGEIKAKSEMARFPAEFVAAHEFDLIFLKWVLPGIWMFFSSGLLLMVAIILLIVERTRRTARETQ